MANPAPFSRYEFMIAWRYLRARRAEGGVSVMTWISLIGIALGVLLGALYPDAGAAMKPLGDGFIRLIRMIIAPPAIEVAFAGRIALSPTKPLLIVIDIGPAPTSDRTYLSGSSSRISTSEVICIVLTFRCTEASNVRSPFQNASTRSSSWGNFGADGTPVDGPVVCSGPVVCLG